MSTNVTSSLVSPVSVFHVRLMASPILAIAVPFGVYRSSGSRVRFPIRMTLLKLAITVNLFGGRLCRGRMGEENAENLFVQRKAAAQLINGCRRAFEDHVDVVAGGML